MAVEVGRTLGSGSARAGARACAAEAIAMRRQPEEPTQRPGKRMGAGAGARRRGLRRSAAAGDRAAAARVAVAVDMGFAGRDEAEWSREASSQPGGEEEEWSGSARQASSACAVAPW